MNKQALFLLYSLIRLKLNFARREKHNIFINDNNSSIVLLKVAMMFHLVQWNLAAAQQRLDLLFLIRQKRKHECFLG